MVIHFAIRGILGPPVVEELGDIGAFTLKVTDVHADKRNPAASPLVLPEGHEYLLRGICIHNKSHNFHLIWGLKCVYIFPGVVYQPRHVFQNDDFGSKLCIHTCIGTLRSTSL